MDFYFPESITDIDGLVLNQDERRFLGDASRHRSEFLRVFAQRTIEGQEICPNCLNFRVSLYEIPSRLTKYLYMYAVGKQRVCAYCLSDAATERKREMAERKAEDNDGEIVISEITRKFMRSAGVDLDNRRGAVYLANRGNTTKIGATSRDVRERVRQLGSRTHTLLMALYLDAPFILESYLHARFINKQVLGKNYYRSRVSRRTDYFCLSQDDFDFISGIRLFEGMPVRVELA